MKSWFTFIRERFPLTSYVPMVTVFTLANACIAFHFSGIKQSSGFLLLIIWCLTLSFFFRLRLFDELKDLEVDKVINPQRPLARGVLQPGAVKIMLGVLIVVELVTTAYMGRAAFITQCLAITYSLFMYNEFFIGKWLRPKFTLYAITHTAVSVLLACAVISQCTGIMIHNYKAEIVWLIWINWFLFNIFEFARKTFSANEESPLAESYSNLYGRAGAFLLTAVQSVAAIAILFYIFGAVPMWYAQVVLFVVLLVISMAYIFSQKSKLYRMAWAFYIVLFYAGIIAMFKPVEVIW